MYIHPSAYRDIYDYYYAIVAVSGGRTRSFQYDEMFWGPSTYIGIPFPDVEHPFSQFRVPTYAT
jgi:hypothetical protein